MPVAHIREEKSDTWWRCDDEVVTKLEGGPSGNPGDLGLAAEKKEGPPAKGKGRPKVSELSHLYECKLSIIKLPANSANSLDTATGSAPSTMLLELTALVAIYHLGSHILRNKLALLCCIFCLFICKQSLPELERFITGLCSIVCLE